MSDNRYFQFFQTSLSQQKFSELAEGQSYITALLTRLEARLVEGGHAREAIDAEMALASEAAQAALAELSAPATAPPAPMPELVKAVTPAPAQEKSRSSPLWRVLRWLLALTLVCAYALTLYFFVQEESDTIALDGANGDAVIALDIGVADLSKEKILFHITPKAGRIVQKSGQLSQELTLDVDAGENPLNHTFKANTPMTPWTIQVNIDAGDILDYPFDHYVAALNINARSGTEPIKLVAVLDHVPHGLTAHMEDEASKSGTLGLSLTVKRSPTIMFVIFLSVMSLSLVTISACTVAYHVVANGRKIEFGMMVWTAALLFVVPTVRNALPNSPPMGSFIDFAVFFWLQAAVAIAMASLALTWVRRG